MAALGQAPTSVRYQSLGSESAITFTENMQTAIAAGDALGRKFSDIDVAADGVLALAAYEYAFDYVGSFGYMLDMRTNVRRRSPQGEYTGYLTDRQSAGVLNCLLAEARRRRERAEVEQTAVDTAEAAVSFEVQLLDEDGQPAAIDRRPIPNGTYTIVSPFEPTGYRTIKIEADFRIGRPDNAGLPATAQQIAFLSGPDNETDFTFCAFLLGTNITMKRVYRGTQLEESVRRCLGILNRNRDNQDTARTEYALRSGRCARCGRTLTVPASLHRGLGPVCAGLY
jgi:hypothetical protein